MTTKRHSPVHDDERPPLLASPLSSTAAAPARSHAAIDHSGTNGQAPVNAESCAAVEAEKHQSGSAADPARWILHVDIDAFFAAIEQLRDPRLRGKPVIVGAGVIASCSYEARRFGLKAGMSLSEAKRLCPDAVILEGHAQVYRCFADQIFACCRDVAPAVETFLDEAYCDLSGTERLHGDLLAAGASLKQRVLDATGLTVTCGLGPNRMLAKLIGKTVKPDGLARITPQEADAFLVDRPIEQLAGVGHSHAKTLRSMNLHTIGALRALSADALAALFGSPGRMLYERCRGRDTAVVTEREIPLSISRETSFHRDTADRTEIEGMLEYLVGRACRAARELGIQPRTVAVRFRYTDDESDEQARSLKIPSSTDPVVLAVALDILCRRFTRRVALHAVGVSLSNFASDLAEQGSLFDEAEAGRRQALYEAFDGVRDAYGHGVLVSGRALNLKGRVKEDRHGFVLRTPSLTK
ncbi:MAG: DNA polymerase IV [Candidatus Eisenbacteria bacterium]|uniref:DNA-directed DNA polymerase n=1 Tax=Eiseniibacteriota bacterium TaxID=2212470 RepID=A0A849SQF2_UNCEI|nr:DNA polymerase IV [Candidatus Eisenbacteria bacterium]